MNNQTVIDFMVILQAVSFWIMYIERYNIRRQWKDWTIKEKIGRTFFMFIPLLVIVSLFYRPL